MLKLYCKGEIVQIKYKIKDTSKIARISLKDIELTTISYNIINVTESVSKDIGLNNNNNNNNIINNTVNNIIQHHHRQNYHKLD